MPNMTADTSIIVSRMLKGVETLRAHSNAPILLVEHSGYTNEYTSDGVKTSYRAANLQLRKAYNTLMKAEVAYIYYLTKEEIGLSMDSMVEGVHPSDLGMQQYADAYLRKISEILGKGKNVIRRKKNRVTLIFNMTTEK